ncbi:hypothetical protein PZA11_005651 [Diplocarpon coronariae]|uniref:Uncharacterized protein n=1 Tax=Diplocarpon coronariae TaxID=2795749 RepID=A0A218Z852_9HELO|nr:hypothetical protein B2J93_9335 [Marssonina coronariae]
MSEVEIDRQWKPSGRPTSTMAQSFSLALNDLFKIDNSLADLDAAVSEKYTAPRPLSLPAEHPLTARRKKAVSTQTSELEALEARLKETEERLKAAASGSPPRKSPDRFSSRPQDTFKGDAPSLLTTGLPAAKDGRGCAAGELPPTPGPSEGEAEPEQLLDEGRPRADKREDGDAPPQK